MIYYTHLDHVSTSALVKTSALTHTTVHQSLSMSLYVMMGVYKPLWFNRTPLQLFCVGLNTFSKTF